MKNVPDDLHERIRERARTEGRTVGQYVLEARRDPSDRRCREAVEDLRNVPVKRVRTDALIGRAWELRHDVTPYDAMYVALAEELDCALLTTDGKLSRAPTLTVPIIAI